MRASLLSRATVARYALRHLTASVLVWGAALALPALASATPYSLSGTAFWTGASPFSQFNVSGTLDLGDPTLINMGPEAPDGSDRYRVSYAMTYAFSIGDERLSGRGYMVVDAHGCGLFDCNFAAPLADRSGNAGWWTTANGAFFRADRTAYPDMLLHSLEYANIPDIVEFYGSDLNTRGWGDRFFLREPLVATRVAGVPEPSTLLLVVASLAVGFRRSCVNGVRRVIAR